MYTPKGRALAEEIVKKKKYVSDKRPQDLIAALNEKGEGTGGLIASRRKKEKDFYDENLR